MLTNHWLFGAYLCIMRLLVYIALCLALFIPETFAQDSHPILREFFGRQEGNTIVLTWVIKGGNTCQGTRIHRFNADSIFEQIGEYDGICGDASSDERYEFTDSSPLLNQTNHYRLELGHQGYTNTIGADFYTYNGNGYVILGNPMVKSSEIVFENPKGDELMISLYDLNGRMVLNQPAEKTKAIIYNEGYKNGVYTFVISREGEAFIKGKILVISD